MLDRGRVSVEPDTETDNDFVDQWRSLVGFASAVTGDHVLGEDLAQIAFTELLATTSEVHDEGAWLRTVVVRRARNHWRSQARERNAFRRVATAARHDNFPRASGEPDDAGHPSNGTSVSLIEAIEQLSPRQRAAVLLVYGEDRNNDEAARILGCAPSTLRVHLHRARKQLRQLLQDQQEADHHG
jgi:RNA polymerase sigma factor (sigma-70 family)